MSAWKSILRRIDSFVTTWMVHLGWHITNLQAVPDSVSIFADFMPDFAFALLFLSCWIQRKLSASWPTELWETDTNWLRCRPRGALRKDVIHVFTQNLVPSWNCTIHISKNVGRKPAAEWNYGDFPQLAFTCLDSDISTVFTDSRIQLGHVQCWSLPTNLAYSAAWNGSTLSSLTLLDLERFQSALQVSFPLEIHTAPLYTVVHTRSNRHYGLWTSGGMRTKAKM